MANYDFTYTGAEIQAILDTAKKLKDSGYIFLGVATPSTNPGTPTQKVYYEAKQAGTYTNFGGVVLPDGISLLIWNGSWTSETVMCGDGGVFDISVYKSTGGTLATFADLSAALNGGNNIPVGVRKGGMSVKFVQSSDNKYVQFHLVADSFTTDTIYWVNDAETKNLKSIDGTIVKCYDNDIIVYDGQIYIDYNLTLTGTGNLAWGHTSSIIPIPADVDVVYFTNVKASAAKYIFTDENNSILCAVAIPNTDTRDYIECPIPPQAKGVVCNANKNIDFKLVFAKSNAINCIRSWNTTHDDTNALRPYYSYNNKLYIALGENTSIQITGNPDKVYKYNDRFYIWRNNNLELLPTNEALSKINEALSKIEEQEFKDTTLEKTYDSSVFDLNITPRTWETNTFYKSAIRSAKGLRSIKLISWGLTGHVVFSAKDAEGNIIPESKVYGKGYTKTTYEIPILDTYDTYCAGHIIGQQGCPPDSEANLTEYVRLDENVAELNKAVDNLYKGYLPPKQIISTDFTTFTVDGDVKDHLNGVGNLEGNSGGSCKVTDYIDCGGYNQIECNISCQAIVYCAFYLADKSWFGSFQIGSSPTSVRTHKIIAIPNGVKYVRLTNNVTRCAAPTATLRKVLNWWENRKIAIFGTSVPAGYPSSAYEQQIADGKQDIYSFVNVAIRNIGAIPLNYCVPSGAMRATTVDGTNDFPQWAFSSDAELTPNYGGNGLQNVTYKNTMLPLLDTDNEPDLFLFVNYGTNDSHYDHTDFENGYTPDYTSIQSNTFVGGFNKVLKALYDAYPYARVGIITTQRDRTGLNDYVKNANDQTYAIARLWSAPCLKFNEMTGLVENGIVDNSVSWMQSDDKLHFANFNKQKGVELIPRMAKLVEEWLKSLS